MISFSQVQERNSRDNLWVVIHGSVYDLTAFVNEHPGGSKVILQVAGKDATKEFSMYHPPDMMDRFLDKKFHLGKLDTSTAPKEREEDQSSAKIAPPLSKILNTFDFESVAKEILTPEAWAYYSSGGDNELTLQENHAAFSRIWLKPRVLINVKKVNTSTSLLGTKTSLPLYITATALGKLGHRDGEVVLTRAAGSKNIIQMIPTLASCSIDEMVSARAPTQTQWFQLYVNSNRQLTADIIEKAIRLGITSIFITVDAPQLGRREKDMRVKFVDDAPDVQSGNQIHRTEGAARAISSFIDASLSWDDIPFFQKVVGGRAKVVLKGIQCGEDAVLAAKSGVDGIVLSNHGGRQLDTSRSSIEVLKEVTSYLKESNLNDRLEIFIDGGIRRGTDIFKALAMGAKGVGLGRPFLYAMSGYGQPGVERMIADKDILTEELEMVMRLMGVTEISQINETHILTENLSARNGFRDYLSTRLYEPMKSLVSKL